MKRPVKATAKRPTHVALPMNSHLQQLGRAIVIGGSMAGLGTARILADHYSEVFVFERDALATSGEHRRGVPQSRHSHVMLASGCRAYEALFPGLTDELALAGAVRGDVAAKVRWFVEDGRLVRFESGLEGIGVSRPLIERAVRARVAKLPNVRIHDNVTIDGLAVSRDKGRVVGVVTEAKTVTADLVVDAGGRGSRAPLWLEALGYERPPEERVEIDLRYTTRLFRRLQSDLAGDQAAIVPPTPYSKRGGGMIALEGERWIVTLITHFGDFAPQDLPGFIEFTRTLPDACIHEVIARAEPLGDAETIRMPASIRHRYERLKRFPAGYLVMGDAVSSFNPVYGQGMSVAILEALALGHALRRGDRGLARRFFSEAAKIVDGAWAIAAGNDLRMPEATGRRNVAMTLVNAYVPRLLRAGRSEADCARAFLEVSNLLAPPRSLFRPSLIARALRAPAEVPNTPAARKRSSRNEAP